MKSLKRVLSYALPYKSYAVINVVSNLFYAIFSLLSIIMIMPVLGVLFDSQKKVFEAPSYNGLFSLGDYLGDYLNYWVTMQVTEYGEIKALAIVSIVGAILFFLKNVFRYSAVYFLAFLRSGVSKDMQNHLHRKIIVLPISFFTEKRKGDVIARMTSDVNEIQWAFLSSLEMIVREPLMIVTTLIAMVSMSWQLTVFVFVLLPISGGIISFVGNSLKKKSVSAQNTNAHLLALIEEHISGLRVIKAFTAENKIISIFKKSTQDYFDFTVSVNHRRDLASPMSEFLGSVVIFSIVYYGGTMVFSGSEGALLPQEFIAYIGLFYNILNPAKALTTAFYNMKKGEASSDRIFEILDTENPIVDKENAIEKTSFDKEISIDKVSFKYEEKLVINDFSLNIEKGKTIALVGQSGSGKTTMANLIPRFYDINSGAIKIDGFDIRDISKKSLRTLMGIVTQESILFNDSVKGNLLLGSENKTDQEIIEAAKIANAHQFIEQLPQGYETNIGDGGNKLSGGQKQRLSIARAVLSNPDILILDEATSALDTESEQLVQEALNKLMKNRTSIVIAHRLSTIQNADEIIVMNEGRIIERGTHQELIEKEGAYNKLIQMQSFE